MKRLIPRRILNESLLRMPWLYRLPFIRWETSLHAQGIEDLLEQLLRVRDVPGDIIECGTSRAGATVLMASAVRRLGVQKTIFACDSFEGFDRAEFAEERRRGTAHAPDDAFTSTSLDYVSRKLRTLGVEDHVKPVKGYFQDTLPGLPGPWCFSLIDCDLERSLLYCAETVWRRLTPGGHLVFDDYACDDFAGARRGVDRFVAAHAPEIAEHGLLRRLYLVRKRA